jgi:hypothetical protein
VLYLVHGIDCLRLGIAHADVVEPVVDGDIDVEGAADDRAEAIR